MTRAAETLALVVSAAVAERCGAPRCEAGGRGGNARHRGRANEEGQLADARESGSLRQHGATKHAAAVAEHTATGAGESLYERRQRMWAPEAAGTEDSRPGNNDPERA